MQSFPYMYSVNKDVYFVGWRGRFEVIIRSRGITWGGDRIGDVVPANSVDCLQEKIR